MEFLVEIAYILFEFRVLECFEFRVMEFLVEIAYILFVFRVSSYGVFG